MARRKLTLANNPLLSGPGLKAREEASAIPYREVNIGAIDRDSNQPRVHFDKEKLTELADSIKLYGILSPILVRPSKLPGKYMLISGERRLRAAKICGLSSVPAIVKDSDESGGEETLAVQLVENIQRADLTPLERSHAIGALKEAHDLSVRQVAQRLGVSKSMVQRSLEILELPADLLNALREGASESKILMLADIEDEAERARLLKNLEDITRDDLKDKIAAKPGKKKKKAKKDALSAEDRRISDEIQRALGLKATLKRSGGKGSERGRLTLDFYSDDDLQLLFRKLVSEG